MSKNKRADVRLFEQGLADSREQAKRLIMAGKVFIGEGDARVRVEKPGQALKEDVDLQVVGRNPFVSRGAYKLLTAFEHFDLNVENYICLDAGASTGGFTDLLLRKGAKKVYAVDVGKHQLHERMQADERVISMEGVNLRYAEADLIPEPVDIIVADLSFISLTLVLPVCLQWLKTGGKLCALIKPQFELGPEATVKGVVRDEKLRQKAVDKILDFCKKELELKLEGYVPSEIKGPKGNQEYIALWYK